MYRTNRHSKNKTDCSLLKLVRHKLHQHTDGARRRACGLITTIARLMPTIDLCTYLRCASSMPDPPMPHSCMHVCVCARVQARVRSCADACVLTFHWHMSVRVLVLGVHSWSLFFVLDRVEFASD